MLPFPKLYKQQTVYLNESPLAHYTNDDIKQLNIGFTRLPYEKRPCHCKGTSHCESYCMHRRLWSMDKNGSRVSLERPEGESDERTLAKLISSDDLRSCNRTTAYLKGAWDALYG